MLRLTVLTGARAGARFELAKPVVRIGRAPDNDIALDPNVDLDASAYHVEIRGESGQWVLVDLNSRNGTFMPLQGMRRIQQSALQLADQIQLGPQGPRIQIELLAPPATTQPQYPAQAYPIGPAHPLGPTVPTGFSASSPMPAPPPPMPTGAPPPAPAPPGPPAQGPRKMGQQTLLAHVGAMIQQQNRGKSTQEIKAFVDQNVQTATKRMRVVIGVLVLLVVASGVAITVLALKQDDPTALREELEKLGMDDPKRAKIEKKLGQISGSSSDLGRRIYDDNKGALFMLVAHRDDSYEHGGFCTAFAIKPKVLASNAHCVKAAEEMEAKGADIWAHLNDSTKKGKPKMFPIAREKGHPKYRHETQTITPDVGLFLLGEGEAPATVTLADQSELKKLGTGDSLYVIGFPGRTMDEASPLATFIFSHVGRITSSNGQRADSFADGWLIQHEGQTTPGTSGSPIFDGEGHVVAINAGGLLESNHQAVYKYAMRIDLLDDIDLDKSAPKKSDDDDKPKKKPKKSEDDDE